jgi:hypothetical protein
MRTSPGWIAAVLYPRLVLHESNRGTEQQGGLRRTRSTCSVASIRSKRVDLQPRAVDPDFPYLGSFIGALDLDTAGLVGFDPGDGSLGPPVPIIRTRLTNFDFMGYCNPDWTSDYTYNALSLCVREVGQGGSSIIPGCGAARSSADGADAQFGDWLAVFGNTSPEPGAAAFLQTERVERSRRAPAHAR